jgi:hypothetical protein
MKTSNNNFTEQTNGKEMVQANQPLIFIKICYSQLLMTPRFFSSTSQNHLVGNTLTCNYVEVVYESLKWDTDES